MKKERLLYLDFIRAIAAISIILTHYNARYILLLEEPVWKNVVLTGTVANIYIGNWGVSLFFIISGAALMYTYDDKCNLKYFYKKRFKAIYPMFWIAYAMGFLYYFYIYKAIPFNAPKINFIFTILGMDGYLMENIPTFYILGEWFLGAIILMYIIFPFLRIVLDKHPKILAFFVVIIYLCVIWKYDLPLSQNKFLLTRIPEFLFGMYFVKYMKKVNKLEVFIAATILILNTILRPEFNESLQTTYVGISSFIVLVFISGLMKYNFVKLPCEIISKYSYAIFLVHHIVIAQVMAKFDYPNFSVLYSYVLFALCCTVIAVMTIVLYRINSKVLAFVGACCEKTK